MFLFSFILILISSYLMSAVISQNKIKNNAAFVFLCLIFFAQIVFSFEILSLFSQIGKNQFLICNIIFFILSVLMWFLKGKPVYIPAIDFLRIKNAVKKDKILLLASVFFILFLIFELLTSLLCPIGNGDVLMYIFPRCTMWIQNGNINHFVTPDTRELIMPVNTEFLYTWIFLFFKNYQLCNLVSYFGLIACFWLVYNILTECGYCIRKRLWAVYLLSSFYFLQKISYQSMLDGVAGSLLLACVYLFFLYSKNEFKENKYIYFSALALALAMGTKTTAIIACPGLALLFAFIVFKYNKKEIFPVSVKFISFLIINFIIFSSYNYVLNFMEFANPVSCREQLLVNQFRGGIKGYLYNLFSYFLYVFDMSGLKFTENYNNFMFLAENKLFSLLRINPELYNSNYFANFSNFDNTMNKGHSLLGAMGLFALFPSLLLSFKYLKAKHKFILFGFGSLLIFNILLFSRVMVYTVFNIRYLIPFIIISSPILVLSYIKSNKNIYKWFLLILMFVYLVVIPHKKPVSFLVSYNLYKKSMPNLEHPFKSFIKPAFEEEKIFDYLKNNNAKNVVLIAKRQDMALYHIEKLRFYGIKIDKILIENINSYDISQYDYAVLPADTLQASYIKGKTESSECIYKDFNNQTITTDNTEPATVICKTPVNYFLNHEYERVSGLELNKYYLLKQQNKEEER